MKTLKLETSIAKLWAAEYSPSQRCFHADTLERTLYLNGRDAEKKSTSDWVIFFIGSSNKEACAACDVMRKMHKNLKTSAKPEESYLNFTKSEDSPVNDSKTDAGDAG